MSFCWREEYSGHLLDTTLSFQIGPQRHQSSQQALLKSHLTSQYGIVTPEIIPLIKTLLGLPHPSKDISFSPILNYKNLLTDACQKQLSFLNDTGVKLEAYYSTLPSGNYLEDRQFEDMLCSNLFGDESPADPSGADVTTPASSVISGMPSPVYHPSPFLSPRSSKPLKRVGSDFRLKKAIPSNETRLQKGYQKHNPGRNSSLIREASLEQLSRNPLYEFGGLETSVPLKNQENTSWSCLDDAQDQQQSGSPGLLSPREHPQSSRNRAADKTDCQLEYKTSLKKKNESLQRDSSKPPDANPRTDDMTKNIIIQRCESCSDSEDEEDGLPVEVPIDRTTEMVADPQNGVETPDPEVFEFDIPTIQPIEEFGSQQLTPQKDAPDTPLFPGTFILCLDYSRCGSPKVDQGDLRVRQKQSRTPRHSEDTPLFSISSSPSTRDSRLNHLLAPRVDWRIVSPLRMCDLRQSVTITTSTTLGMSIRDLKEIKRLPSMSRNRVQVALASADGNTKTPLSLRFLQQ